MHLSPKLAGLACATAIALQAAPVAGAQQQQQEAPAESWVFRVTPYAWASGISGTVGVEDRTADVDLSVGDIIDKLDFAIMAATELRHGPLSFLLDGFWVKISDEAAVPVEPLTSASVEQKQLMLQPEVGYTVFPAPSGGLDLVGGARYWRIETTLDLLAGDTSVASVDGTTDWVDAVLGARYRGRLGDRWPLMLLGDAGTGGSKFTWQAVGSLGFEFSACCVLSGGYRYLHYKYEKSGVTYDLGMGGPLLGFTFRF